MDQVADARDVDNRPVGAGVVENAAKPSDHVVVLPLSTAIEQGGNTVFAKDVVSL